MTWFALYLLATLLNAMILCLVSTHKGSKVEIDRADVVMTSVLLAIWPITLTILIPVGLLIAHFDEKNRNRYNDIMNEHFNRKATGIESRDRDDRRQIFISLAESDLKLLMKLSRHHDYKGRFSPDFIEDVRAELINRATEKTLLGAK